MILTERIYEYSIGNICLKSQRTVIQMADYISRKKAVEAIQYRVCQGHGNKEHICERGSCAYCGIMEIMSDISSIEAADVQPVKHGRWIHIRGLWWQCSNCEDNLIFTTSDRGRTEIHRYCSKCGARMDGDSE